MWRLLVKAVVHRTFADIGYIRTQYPSARSSPSLMSSNRQVPLEHLLTEIILKGLDNSKIEGDLIVLSSYSLIGICS